jgi:hypothetical protein
VSPYDEQTQNSPSTTVNVGGASLKAGSNIQIQVCTPSGIDMGTCSSGSSFTTIATTTAATINGYKDSEGYTWYAWEQFITIPASYWLRNRVWQTRPGPYASVALRVLDNGGVTVYYKNDPSDCPEPYGMAQIGTNNPLCAHGPLSPNQGIRLYAVGP